MIKNNTMNIVFSSDDNFAQHLCVAMYSLLLYNTMHINIYILDGGISDLNKDKILLSLDNFLNKKVCFVGIDTSIFENFKEIGHISKASYFRLILPNLFPNLDKILYLDCDILVQESLQELYDMGFEGKSLLAAKELNEDYGMFLYNTFGTLPSDNYFNTGILLINLSKIRSLGIISQMLDFAVIHGNALRYADQDVLNHFFIHDRKQISLERNANHSFFIRSKNQFDFMSDDEFLRIKNYPKIIHFTGPKPWNYGYVHPFKQKYFEYLSYTEFKNFLIKNKSIKDFLFKRVSYLYLKYTSYLPNKYFSLLRRFLSKIVY